MGKNKLNGEGIGPIYAKFTNIYDNMCNIIVTIGKITTSYDNIATIIVNSGDFHHYYG